MRTYLRTHVRTYRSTYIHMQVHTYVLEYIQKYIPKHIRTHLSKARCRCNGRKVCDFPGKPHIQLTGSGPDGKPMTARAQTFPSKMCSALARVLLAHHLHLRSISWQSVATFFFEVHLYGNYLESATLKAHLSWNYRFAKIAASHFLQYYMP